MIGDVVGHSSQIEYFKNALINKNFNHAYLFEGPSGIGKKTLAYEIIREILCDDDRKKSLFDAGNFSDFLEIPPSSKDKKTEEIQTEDIKQIHEYLSIRASYGEKKIVLIDGAEKMNLHAQNKILKIIEEPPSYAMFFLISSHKDKIVDTLLSRLMRISFNALSTGEIKEYCRIKGLDFDENTAIVSNGSIAKYENLIHKDMGDSYSLAFEIIDAIKNKDKVKIFEQMKKIDVDKDNLKEVLDILEFSYREFFDFESVEVLKIADYLKIIGESRYRLNRNCQKDILITALVYKLEGVFK